MNESKFKRMLVASLVAGTMLILILSGILVYQLFAISHERRLQQEFNEQIEYYRTLTENEQNILEARQTRRWIIQRARELGYSLPDDVILGD